MTTTIHLLDATRASRPRRVLGVVLGPRAAGLAVTTAAHVVHHQVLNLHKLTSRTGKEARVRQVVDKLLERHEPSMLVLVAIRLPATDTALVTAVEAWMHAEVARRGLPLRRVTAPEVRLALVPPGERPSGRNLAEALAQRFEAVRPLAPSREPIPGADRVASLAQNGRRTRTSRELYWATDVRRARSRGARTRRRTSSAICL